MLLSRRAWLTIAATLGVAAFPSAASAAPGCSPGVTGPAGGTGGAGGVNVHVTRAHEVIWCPADVIAQSTDVPAGTNYPVRSSASSPSDNPVGSALSINHLLELAGLDPATVGFTDVLRPAGTFSTLTTPDLADPSGSFQNGLLPVVWVDGTTMHYTRPLRANDPSDENAQDQLTATDGQALELFVHSGPLLRVTATASSSDVSPRVRVGFRATVAPKEGDLTYSWEFGDGSKATGPTPHHAFAAAGRYPVLVTVTSANEDSGGTSEPILITVGAPPKGAGSHAGVAGGAKGGAEGAKRPTNASSGGSPSSHGNTAGPTVPGQSSKASSPGSTTSHARYAAVRARSHRTRTHRRVPARSRNETRRVRAKGLTVIHGRLIADAVPLSPPTSAARTRAGAAPAAAATTGPAPSPAGAIGAGCAIILLLGTGAGSELRKTRRSRTSSPA